MTALQPYPVYKDSGVEWLGEVPEHWQVRRLGTFGRFFKGGGGTKTDDTEQGVPCVRYGDLYTRHQFHITESKGCVAPHCAGAYTPIRYGDVLFAGSGETLEEIGKSAVNLIRESAVCGGDVIVFRPVIDVDAEFIGWSMDCRQAASQKARMGRGITVMHIYSGDLKCLAVPLPPLRDQTVIARFLDHADRRIRRYIRSKERLIELLAEQKQAIIHQAVTGQIDVRTGRPYTAYKDSGLQWLGNIPAHWERCRLRNVVSSVTTGSRGWSRYAADTGPLFVRIANLSRGSLEMRFDDIVRLDLPSTSTSEAARTRIKEADLLLSVTAYIGSVAVAPEPEGFEEAYVSQHVARCEPSPRVSSRWLGYVLLSRLGQVHGQMSLYGGTKDGLSLDDVKNYPIVTPPRDEQDRLVFWIERELSLLGQLRDQVQRQIALLRDYRTRLIADVVIGKVDVREAAGTVLASPSRGSMI